MFSTMFNGWIVDAFRYFLDQLSPMGGQPLGYQLVSDYLGVWTPDLSGLASGGEWGWLMVGMTGLGVVIGLWYAIPVLISAMASGDVRAIGTAFVGLCAAAAAGPIALWVASQLRQPVIDTAAHIMSSSGVQGVFGGQAAQSGLFAALMVTIAMITYVLAGLIASYTFIFITIAAPIAAASLVLRGGVATFTKWLSWFGALLLAPIWAAVGLAVANMMSKAAPVTVAPLAWGVGVILAGLAPLTVLALTSKLIPHGGAAGESTKVGGGHAAATAATSAAQSALMKVSLK